MIFKRTERYEPISFSARKAAAFQRRLQRERNAYPLFTTLIAEEQADWETEKQQRELRARTYEQRWRDAEARRWRSARAAYFALPAAERAACKAEWAAWRGPHTPSCLSYVINKYNGIHELRRARFREEQRALRRKIAESEKNSEQLELSP